MINNTELKQTFIKSLVFALAISLVGLVIFSRSIIIAGLIGVGVGCVASPFLTYLRAKFKIPRVIGALALIGILFFLFAGLFLVTGQLIKEQFQNFQEQIPYFINKVESWRQLLSDHYPALGDDLKSFSISEHIKAGGLRLLKGLGTGINATAGIGLAFFIALYTGINTHEYFEGWVSLFPKKHRSKVSHLSRKSGEVLRLWFSAQLIDMALVGILTAFGLWVVGFDYWALFGLMTALLTIVPYVGVLITFVLAAVVTATGQPELLFWVLGVFFITQQIEGNLILPIVMRERVKLPEAPLLFIIVLMGYWLGILGILIAPGFFAIGRTLYLELTNEGTL